MALQVIGKPTATEEGEQDEVRAEVVVEVETDPVGYVVVITSAAFALIDGPCPAPAGRAMSITRIREGRAMLMSTAARDLVPWDSSMTEKRESHG